MNIFKVCSAVLYIVLYKGVQGKKEQQGKSGSLTIAWIRKKLHISKVLHVTLMKVKFILLFSRNLKNNECLFVFISSLKVCLKISNEKLLQLYNIASVYFLSDVVWSCGKHRQLHFFLNHNKSTVTWHFTYYGFKAFFV